MATEVLEKEKKEEVEKGDIKKLEEAISEELLGEKEKLGGVEEAGVKEAKKEEIDEEEETEEPFSDAIAIIEEVKKEKEVSVADLATQMGMLLDGLEKLQQTVDTLGEKLERLVEQMNMLVESISEMKSLILMISPRKPLAIEKRRKEMEIKELPSPTEVVKKVKEEEKPPVPRVDVDRLLEEIENVIYTQEDVVVHAIKIEGLRITVEEILSDIKKGKLTVPEEKVQQLKKMLDFLKEESSILRPKILALA